MPIFRRIAFTLANFTPHANSKITCGLCHYLSAIDFIVSGREKKKEKEKNAISFDGTLFTIQDLVELVDIVFIDRSFCTLVIQRLGYVALLRGSLSLYIIGLS